MFYIFPSIIFGSNGIHDFWEYFNMTEAMITENIRKEFHL